MHLRNSWLRSTSTWAMRYPPASSSSSVLARALSGGIRFATS
jgi:hypothetical protein